MSGNTFGRLFRLTTFGESHGPALGGVVDGCPPGIPLDEAMIQRELDRRKPGGSPISTPRKEPDLVRLLSGVFEGVTTGTPIGFGIENTCQRSSDYDALKNLFRPGHADIAYRAKYGRRDHRGGGRSSARETVCRVAGGAVAQELLAACGIAVTAYTVEFGGIASPVEDPERVWDRPFFAASAEAVPAFTARAREAVAAGDSLGGVVEVVATGVPAGLGEPVFDKLDARLAFALMGVGAVKGVEIGSGFAAARMTGSENNDPLVPAGTPPVSNNAGGILGGISCGAPIVVRAAVKPIPSIGLPQATVDTDGNPATIVVGGRHDRSAIPRIVPVLKAMVLLTLADFVLLQRRMG
ncbi:chorismate synthase [Desulfolutivibrio sulfoxidireducens]|uniref:chorismate synthase n=1 Tax=Desulfolutivibrio sulfoxidireducens TaxID=2773299 RepID=UPI00159E58B0|nr:chorismate synthase [Desulfolutivibrio sulfoxidireducens]QLA17914.1 chorismate synthase [Desulfolutivibrio sulfoxidireducens]QLA21494.1 chorismate synthase [Desulfolutivibrio sulfoxidireducens]